MSANVEETGNAVTRTLRAAGPVWLILALLGALAWVRTVDQAGDMGGGPGTMGMAFPLFVGTWVVMMAAMMLPAIGPLAAGDLPSRAVPGRAIFDVLAFGLGFLLPWAIYGALAFLALLGADRLVASAPHAARSLGVGLFAVAGLYQFTPWKLRALRHCRMVLHRAEGIAANLRGGIRDGAICVGCCWALMSVLVASGVMNVLAMAGLAVVIFAEKILPRPRLIAFLAGVALLTLAVVAVLHPAVLSGLTAPHTGMEMDMGVIVLGN